MELNRSRWLDWEAKDRIMADSPDRGPTEPSKPSSVGFEGATSAESPEIEVEGTTAEELVRACSVLNRTGVRIMWLDGSTKIGLWSDLDNPDVRAALHAFAM